MKSHLMAYFDTPYPAQSDTSRIFQDFHLSDHAQAIVLTAETLFSDCL